MSVIKNVAITGASGALGKPILDAILNSGKFNVTVLTRASSKGQFPSSVKVVPVDFDSVESLTAALKGQDAVVSAVGTEGFPGQNIVVDAAVAAGVKRFLPSEFGSDLDNPKTKTLPVFGYKVAVAAHIEEVASKNPEFSYTYVRNGPFLDWGLEHNFLFDLASGKPRIFDGGDQLFSTTTLETVGRAVVGVLSKPEETKNRAVYIQDLTTSQNRILALAKEVAPEKSFEPVPASLDDVYQSSNEKLSKGEVTMEVMVGYLFVSILKEGYGGKMEKTDNELLGLGQKTEEDIKAILRKLLKK
ncbi:hypothetical protein CJF32_00008613 [Rutstroemia sp. NJR-2017a WRK4]|nr:hypothetical protein CJF32_00008613 [Rutstroemia sp. NJR-2017a WRK4]